MLSADNSHEIFIKCLFKNEEPKDNPVIVDGITMKVGFHPQRVKENENKIIEMLAQLPEEFQQSGGEGMSFLNACNDKNGRQWADMHRTMEELVCLGIAIGKVKFLMPRDLWSVLPGGMPYFVVLNNEQEVKECDATGDAQSGAAGDTKNLTP